jgi:uncharacterized protein involved in outer membrane biogenesis
VTRSRRTLLVTALLLAITLVVLLSRASRATPHVRDHVIATMKERFHGNVELDAFQVGVFPRPEINGSGLVVRRKRDGDDPPIIRLGTFSASAGVLGLIRTPVRLRTVTLDRLEIQIPPGGLRGASADRPATPQAQPGRSRARLTIDEIVSHAATLEIASNDPGKLPRVFDIHDLHIFGYGEREGAEFRASLTNPKPEGRIETTGRLGPWQPDEPRTTPVGGAYTFTNADMNTIRGLGGTLSSRGSYTGVLERIEVSGETHTPDFSIDVAGQPVPLETRFKAVVDGTNGNTYLEQVDARLLESHIHAKGAVVRTEDVKGRHVALTIRIDNARIEDLLRLALKGTKPPLTGAVTVDTTFTLPAGEADVIRKLRLDGNFALAKARFTNFDVQRRISMLSQKGKGEAALDEGESTVSELRGRFVLRDAALSFSGLTFAVPGAVVQLAGTYHLESELLDFAGDLLLDASLRETTSGVKAVLATIAQPLFRRNGGGTKIPIRVGGTRNKPSFGLDVKRALLPGD